MKIRSPIAWVDVRAALDRYLPLILTALFAIVMLPGTAAGNRSYMEVWSFSQDEGPFSVTALTDIAHGHTPGFYGYGGFPPVFTMALFAPAMLVYRLAGLSPNFGQLVAFGRLAELLIAYVGLVSLFALCREFVSRPAALLAATLLGLTSIWIDYALVLHPDIFQATAYIAGVYFLVRYFKYDQRRDFYFAAIAGGISAGSKYWGTALLAPMVLVLALKLKPGQTRTAVRRAFAFGGLFLLTFFFVNPAIVRRPAYAYHRLQYYYGKASEVASLTELLPDKIAVLTSPQVFGTLFFLVALAAGFAQLYRVARREKPTAELIVHTAFWAVGAFFFLRFNDPVNVPGGERYALLALALMPAMVFPFVADLLRTKRYRGIGIALTIALTLSQILRIGGVRTTRLPLGQSDLLGRRTADVRSVPETLGQYYAKESRGGFLVWRWLAAELKTSSLVYGEVYMNRPEEGELASLARWEFDYWVKPERIAELKPDYVCTRKSELADRIAKESPYTIAAVLGEYQQVYVLKRHARR